MQQKNNKIESNIWKFYLYRFFSCSIFVIPIFILFYLDNGLSMTQIMVLNTAYTFVMMITVIYAGVVADKIGRKKVLVANSIFFFLGWFLFAFSHSFFHFLVCEILMALSAAFWSASGTAFFYDSVKEIGKEKQFKKLYGNVVSINYIVWGISALIGSYIASADFRNVFIITGIFSFLAFIITLTFREPKGYSKETHYITHLKETALFIIRSSRVRIFVLCSSIVFAVFLIGSIFYQPYLKSISLPLVYFGLIYFFMEISAAVGSKISHKLEIKLGEKKILIFLLALMVLSFFGMTKVAVLIGVVFPIMMYFASGIFEPVITDYINKLVKSYHRATVASINSLLQELIATVLSPFFGYIADAWSLNAALLASSIMLLLALLILIISFYSVQRIQINA
jgi:MFS family permease